MRYIFLPSHSNRSRYALAFLLTIYLLCTPSALSQDRIAEGEYQMRATSGASAPLMKSATRWTLYSKSSGGYHLESEVQNLSGGLRIIQVEELDKTFAPTSIGYRLYRRGQKQPGIVMNCEIVNDSVTCGGYSEKGPIAPSAPYKYHGPFWLWVEGLFSMDMPWLLDGAANMIPPGARKATVTTLTVSGGVAGQLGEAVNVANLEGVKAESTAVRVPHVDTEGQWEFNSDEENALEFVGTDSLELNGTKVAARHYILRSDEPRNIWLAGDGLLVRVDEFFLTNYKQRRRIIPELRTDEQPGAAKPTSPQ